MKYNILQEKSFEFAYRIVKLYLYLSKEKKEFELSKQVLRSGTSVGANVEEAIGAQSKKEFRSKLSISYKEVRETRYWLRLLEKSQLITTRQFNSINKDCEEILKIMVSILKTLEKQSQQ